MRIGFYHGDLPIPGRKPGGVSVLVHRLARELSARGNELTMWSRGPAPADANYRHVRLWPRLQGDAKLARMWLQPALMNAIDWRDIEVLHLHGDDHFLLVRPVATVRTLYGSALLEALHATSVKRRVAQGVTAGLELASSRLATRCYGLGPGVPRIYATAGELDGGVDLPPDGCDLARTRSERPTILFVGTWEGRKRGRLLHRVFTEEIRPRLPACELVMVSDHCEPADGVRHVQTPSDERLLELYRASWVMCLPSVYEGLGLPYLEAMANGAAVVSSPNPGARHVLGEALAGEAIVADGELGATLLGVLSDRGRREQLVGLGRDRVARFSWDAVVDAHLRAYHDAMQRHRGARQPRPPWLTRAPAS